MCLLFSCFVSQSLTFKWVHWYAFFIFSNFQAIWYVQCMAMLFSGVVTNYAPYLAFDYCRGSNYLPFYLFSAQFISVLKTFHWQWLKTLPDCCGEDVYCDEFWNMFLEWLIMAYQCLLESNCTFALFLCCLLVARLQVVFISMHSLFSENSKPFGMCYVPLTVFFFHGFGGAISA